MSLVYEKSQDSPEISLFFLISRFFKVFECFNKKTEMLTNQTTEYLEIDIPLTFYLWSQKLLQIKRLIQKKDREVTEKRREVYKE